jgi:hypothetical protein
MTHTWRQAGQAIGEEGLCISQWFFLSGALAAASLPSLFFTSLFCYFTAHSMHLAIRIDGWYLLKSYLFQLFLSPAGIHNTSFSHSSTSSF